MPPALYSLYGMHAGTPQGGLSKAMELNRSPEGILLRNDILLMGSSNQRALIYYARMSLKCIHIVFLYLGF